MSGSTTNLHLQYLDASQTQPEVKINDAWDKLDGASAKITVRQVGDSPSGDAFNVSDLRFAGTIVAVTQPSPGVSLVTFTLPTDVDSPSGGGAGVAAQWTINTQAGASYTLQVADEDQTYVRMTSGSANVLNVPTNAAQPILVGSLIRGIQGGNGTTTITPAGGVTVNTPTDYSGAARAKGSFFCLMKIAANVWDLWGDLNYTGGGGGGGGMPGPFDVTIPTDSFSGFDITVGGP